MIRCQPSTLSGSVNELLLMPALLTRMSSRPKRARVCSITFCHADSLVTSVGTNSALPSLAFTSASTARPSSSSTSAITTAAPSRANSRTSSAPMPLAPPLMIATLFASRIARLPVLLYLRDGEHVAGGVRIVAQDLLAEVGINVAVEVLLSRPEQHGQPITHV